MAKSIFFEVKIKTKNVQIIFSPKLFVFIKLAENIKYISVLDIIIIVDDVKKGSSIKYVRKIFRKTNISNPLYAHVLVRIRG